MSASSSTTVAVYLSRSPSFPVNDPHSSHSVQCSVWVGGGRGRDNRGATVANDVVEPTTSMTKKQLQYYSFVDDPSCMDLLLKLITRLQSHQSTIRVIYVAAEFKIHSVARSVLQLLSAHLKQVSFGLATEEAMNNLEDETRVTWLPQFAASASHTSRLLQTVQQSLQNSVTTACARQAATDPTLSSQPVRLALALYWYDNSNTAIASSGGKKSKKGSAGLTQEEPSMQNTADDDDDDDDSGMTEVLPGSLLDDAYLSLDATAAATLHLWPETSSSIQAAALAAGASGTALPNASNSSLYGVLSQPLQTIMGQRCLAHWLRQPLSELSAILHRQQAVATFTQASVGRDAVREALRWNIDVDSLSVKLGKYQDSSAADSDNDDNNLSQPMDVDGATDAAESSSTCSKKKTGGSAKQALMALYQLYLVADKRLPLLTERLKSALQDAGEMQADDKNSITNTSLLQQLCEGLQQSTNELHRASELAQAVLDMDQAPTEYLVRSTYSADLSDVADELAELQAHVEECHAEMNELWAQVKGTSVSNAVRLEQTTVSEWQFRVPDTNDSKLLQTQLGSTVTVHRLLKNGVYFTTKTLRELGSKKQDLLAEYERHQRQVVKDAMKVGATYQAVLQRTSRLVATLDVLVALAHVASYHAHGCYTRPTLTDSFEKGLGINLVQARHPCVELQDNVEYIPNDMRLIFEESSFLLVTGPNMGGKSTYIRALGAIVALAQIGSFVPCTSATINICHHILNRVGAGDLQERGISTFMAEMLESSVILRRATPRSLILIDELGRGTSTFDGYGLARAISEYIVQRIGCLTVFTTHFHELTALETTLGAGVQNCHVTAQKGSHGLTFLYQVQPGPCLESFGIQVAEMANVPNVVIQDAKRKAKELENFEYHKRQANGGANNNTETTTSNTNDEYEVDDHSSAEETAQAMAFVNRFRKLSPSSVQNLVGDTCGSDEEKRATLLQALQVFQV